jgi:hypothetical protein
VVKVWRCTETGEAPRWQGATTEKVFKGASKVVRDLEGDRVETDWTPTPVSDAGISMRKRSHE